MSDSRKFKRIYKKYKRYIEKNKQRLRESRETCKYFSNVVWYIAERERQRKKGSQRRRAEKSTNEL